MLEQVFIDVYTKFKLQFYCKIFRRFEKREASLTAVETFCIEVIHSLGRPTINEFAKFVGISQANAAYKVQSLIEKQYVQKLRSETDKREYYLVPTEKFMRYNELNLDYVGQVVSRMKERFSNEELEVFESMLKTIKDELMPEIELSNV